MPLCLQSATANGRQGEGEANIEDGDMENAWITAAAVQVRNILDDFKFLMVAHIFVCVSGQRDLTNHKSGSVSHILYMYRNFGTETQHQKQCALSLLMLIGPCNF